MCKQPNLINHMIGAFFRNLRLILFFLTFYHLSLHAMAQVGENTMVVDWGANNEGQLRTSFENINVTNVAAGHAHSLAVLDSISVIAWGGETGHPRLDIPSGISGKVIKVITGLNHSILLQDNGVALVWGTNDFGQADASVFSSSSDVIDAEAGDKYSLLLHSDSSITIISSEEELTTLPPGMASKDIVSIAGWRE